jgi:DNA-binding MarR family transcriptional regulator
MPPARGKSKEADGEQASRGETSAQTFDLHLAPGFLFRRLDTRASQLFHEFTAQTEVTPRQFGILVTLLQAGRLTQSELAGRVCTDKSTLGEMLQRMVERGLVRRRIAARDRRTAELSLSPVGRQAVLALAERTEAAQAALLAPLPAEHRTVFLDCLRLLADAEARAGEADED